MNSMGLPQPTGLKGTGLKTVTQQNFTPEQMNLFKSMFSQLDPSGQLSRLAGGDQSQFSQMEQPALQQFNSIQGNLASRFSGQGLGARRSSGFQNASNTAAQDFAQQLQSNRMQLQRQAQQDLFSMGNQLLNQKPYEQSLIPEMQKQPGFFQQLFGALTGGVGQVGGQLSSLSLGKKLGIF